ncbi:MAG: gluconate 2-dehydrogenase subunit 3 family protein [Steroidobacteraceae bacterium]
MAESINLADEFPASHPLASRRAFLASSVAGLVLAAADWPAIAAAAAHAQQAVKLAAQPGQPVRFAVFTAEQAAELEAMVSQIIPSDDTPGAREAGIVYFIDRSLATFATSSRAVYMQGLIELQAKSRQMFPGSRSFSGLRSAQQIELLTAIDGTPFFRTVRDHTVIGMFASPRHGGNRDKAGWKLIGFDDRLNFQPPFGYYDAAPP